MLLRVFIIWWNTASGTKIPYNEMFFILNCCGAAFHYAVIQSAALALRLQAPAEMLAFRFVF